MKRGKYHFAKNVAFVFAIALSLVLDVAGASVAADFELNDVASKSVGGGATDELIFDIMVPDYHSDADSYMLDTFSDSGLGDELSDFASEMFVDSDGSGRYSDDGDEEGAEAIYDDTGDDAGIVDSLTDTLITDGSLEAYSDEGGDGFEFTNFADGIEELYIDDDFSSDYTEGEAIGYDDDNDGIYTPGADTVVDADGTDSAESGSPASDDEKSVGDYLTTFDPLDLIIPIWVNRDADEVFSDGDDLFIDVDGEGYTPGDDTVILDKDGSLAPGDSGQAIYLSDLVYNDEDDNAFWADGEDIIQESYSGSQRWSEGLDTTIAGATPDAGEGWLSFEEDEEMFTDSDGNGEYDEEEDIWDDDYGWDYLYLDEEDLRLRDGNREDDGFELSNFVNERYVDGDGDGVYYDGYSIGFDNDGDGVYTDSADTVVDSDGGDSTGSGDAEEARSAGDALEAFDEADSLVWMDNDGSGDYSGDDDLFSDTNGNFEYDSGEPVVLDEDGSMVPDEGMGGGSAASAGNLVYDDLDASGTWDSGEDILDESIDGEMTYSADADELISDPAGLSGGGGGEEWSEFSETEVYSDSNGNTVYDSTEDIYDDSTGDDTGVLDSATDTLITGSEKPDGTALTDFNVYDRYVDSGEEDGAYSNGEDIYEDKNSDYEVSDEMDNEDTMASLEISNAGTATSADITRCELWREDGTTEGFQSGEDTLVAEDTTPFPCLFEGLAENIPLDGQRFYVTVDVSSGPNDGRTIQAFLGVNDFTTTAPFGYNDGPTDESITNTGIVTLSNPAPSPAPSNLNPGGGPPAIVLPVNTTPAATAPAPAPAETTPTPTGGTATGGTAGGGGAPAGGGGITGAATGGGEGEGVTGAATGGGTPGPIEPIVVAAGIGGAAALIALWKFVFVKFI